jgi:hypothetical protein
LAIKTEESSADGQFLVQETEKVHTGRVNWYEESLGLKQDSEKPEQKGVVSKAWNNLLALAIVG